FRGRLIRHGENDSLAVRPAVEAHAFAGFHIGIVAFAITPERFLAIHHRPAKAAHLVIGIEWRKVMAMPAPELRIFLEQALLQVEAVIARFLVLIFGIEIGERKAVDLAIAK